jgi:hypothetical protein
VGPTPLEGVLPDHGVHTLLADALGKALDQPVGSKPETEQAPGAVAGTVEVSKSSVHGATHCPAATTAAITNTTRICEHLTTTRSLATTSKANPHGWSRMGHPPFKPSRVGGTSPNDFADVPPLRPYNAALRLQARAGLYGD